MTAASAVQVSTSYATRFWTERIKFSPMRGYPCDGEPDNFHGNVVLQGIETAINWEVGGPPPAYLKIDSRFVTQPSLLPPPPPGPPPFSLLDPTRRLGVGDFDGDGKDDLFLATGAGWYYAPGANAEWRFLSAKTETINNLLFGDFDGDGRTDVFTQVGENWMVSWGGRSPWQLLSNRHADWPSSGGGSHGMLDLAVGDFVGDNRADVFYADGINWYVSDGGVGPLVLYASSSFSFPISASAISTRTTSTTQRPISSASSTISGWRFLRMANISGSRCARR
jgi:FG-GAP-like repeat